MRAEVERIIREAFKKAILQTGRVEEVKPSDVLLEKPREGAHGDLATNAALVLASRARISPRALAQEMLARLNLPAEIVSAAEVAGPGFINLRLNEEFLRAEVTRILSETAAYGRPSEKSGERIQLEFVSANPTGPLNVVSARAAAVGDALARILDWSGAHVETEFYVNDGGTQVVLFAASVRACFLELGGVPFMFPEEGYRGNWIGGIARSLWRLLIAVFDTVEGRRPLDSWTPVLAGSNGEEPSDLEACWSQGGTENRARKLAQTLAKASESRPGARRLAEWWLAEEGGCRILTDQQDLEIPAPVRDLGQW